METKFFGQPGKGTSNTVQRVQLQNSTGDCLVADLKKHKFSGKMEFNIDDPAFLDCATLKGKFADNRVKGQGEFTVPAKNIMLTANFVDNRVDGLGKLDCRNFTYIGQWASN